MRVIDLLAFLFCRLLFEQFGYHMLYISLLLLRGFLNPNGPGSQAANVKRDPQVLWTSHEQLHKTEFEFRKGDRRVRKQEKLRQSEKKEKRIDSEVA